MKLDRLPYFAAVLETGSFTRAAERMGVTKAVVSAHVARLEEELGTALLVRTTRKVTATPEGMLLHERCRVILREAANAQDELMHSQDQPKGLLRITAPLDYGQAVLVPLVAQFRAAYPACKVALDLTDQVVDLQSGKWDISLRLGWLTDSSLKSRRVGAFAQYLVATPEIAQSLGQLHSPLDLPVLPFVANSALREPGVWDFVGTDTEAVRVRFDPVVTMTTTPAVLTGVLAGLGCSVLPEFLVAQALTEGRLVRLLPEWRPKDGGIYIVYPPTRFRLPKVTAFVDLLTGSSPRRPAQSAPR